MLYSILRALLQITTRVFFRSVAVRNKELIPAKGPLMVLANHPSTFMDPIVLATILNRKVYFLAKGELFKSPFAKWLLPKLFMIPVYRKQDDPSQMSKNEETFKKCYEHLEKGGAILMFPEGISITERKLRPIKTGASRIVLGAEARNNFQLGVHIVNIGLNYDNPHKFNNNLFVNIHSPIRVADYKEVYEHDTFAGAKELTDEITRQLEKLIVAFEDDRTDELVKDIETLYKHKLTKEMQISKHIGDTEFIVTKNIVDSVNYFIKNDSERVETMRSRIKDYFTHLNNIGLKDVDIAPDRENKSFIANSFLSLFIIILGAPIYLYGLINNILPFEIPGKVARKISKSIEFVGAIGMVGGMFTFLIFYTIQIILCWKFTHIQWLTLAYSISLPLSGLFAYWYFHTVKKIRTKWMLMMLFYKKSVIISNLITEREQIIAEFDKARKDYADYVSAKNS